MSGDACNWPQAVSLELHLLGLDVCKKSQFAHQAQLLLALGLGEGQLTSQNSQRFTLLSHLISDIASCCTQMPGLSSMGRVRETYPVGRTIAFPQADHA